MTTRPSPVIFEPIFKPKPWGGRRLAALLGKALPTGELIGESWELVSLPGDESRVRRGPLAGQTLGDLVAAWGPALCEPGRLINGRFPLLIKFLDARENLSVQVHPRAQENDAGLLPAGTKHEAWYVLHAEPGAEAFIGLKPGVTAEDLARAAKTAQTAALLRSWPVAAGTCFYLPSGIVHALGAGIVVAEVQIPSDVTYRLYDWDRVGPDGRTRELHLRQAIASVRTDVPDELIVQPIRPSSASGVAGKRIVTCDFFTIDELDLARGCRHDLAGEGMLVWIVVAGSGVVCRERSRANFRLGDVVLIPASEGCGMQVETHDTCRVLEVRLPTDRADVG